MASPWYLDVKGKSVRRFLHAIGRLEETLTGNRQNHFSQSLVLVARKPDAPSTDGVDGYLARRHGTTRSGAFLDPLADKALVLGAMWALVATDLFWWLPVALITARELAISGFRSYWGRRGLAVPATGWAKVKTVVQAVAVGLALLPPVAEQQLWLAATALWVATALTLATGAQYLIEGSRATVTGGTRA